MAVDVEKIKQAALRHIKGISPDLWAWGGSMVVFALITLLLIVRLFYDGSAITKKAVFDGQRVSVVVTSGEIAEGNPRHTRRAEAVDTAEAVAAAKNLEGLTPIISKEGLAPAPLAAITEQSDKGIIPAAGHDGTLAWKYYARPYAAAGKRPLVAVVITDLGLSKPQTGEALKLPHNFTLSFSPYASDARSWANEAREEGFESLVDLPLEPSDFPISDPGPYGLLETLDANEARARLHWVLSRFSGYVGVLGSPDEKLTANTGAIRNTLTELSGRGVLFFYMKNDKNAGLADLAKSRALLLVGTDMLIDDDGTPAAIEAQLQKLVDLAKKQGTAIGVAHSYPSTLAELSAWADTLASEGVDLAPASAVAQRSMTP